MIEAQDQESLADELQGKIKVLHDSIWERRADWPLVSKWLDQFQDDQALDGDRLQALYLLSNFMYFGTSEIRALLKSLFRDIFRASVIAELRQKDPKLPMNEAEKAFQRELALTRFVSLGNPSESSAFLLYYFRQEAEIARECFISGAEIFSYSDTSGQPTLRDANITRYVFIDDMCGSGKQGEEYSQHTIQPLKRIKPEAQVYYYALFGTGVGIARLKGLNRFDHVHPVVELDESFKCFCEASRIYKDVTPPLCREAAMALARRFGMHLQPNSPLGYQDGQLLLGFAYNTPDNSLPIIWSSGSASLPWSPVFKRYAKLQYG
jgi:hypothetical protein